MFSEERTIKVPFSKAKMAEPVVQVHTNSKSYKLVLNELPGPHCAMQRYLIESTGNVTVS